MYPHTYPYPGAMEGSELLPYPDVVVSTDVTNSGNENDGAGWGLFGELNTGILLFHSTPSAVALCDEWIRRMQYEMVHTPPPLAAHAAQVVLTPSVAALAARRCTSRRRRVGSCSGGVTTRPSLTR